jgi:hypothetical protein
MRRLIAAFVLALMIVPVVGGAASAATNKVECLFYQTFRERDPGDCVF